MQSEGNPLPGLREAHAMLNVLRQMADAVVADAIELLIRDALDHGSVA
jgi:hypothetical protein